MPTQAPVPTDYAKLTYMCGRFERSIPIDVIIGNFRVNNASIEMAPNYNVAPSQDVLIIYVDHEGNRQLAACSWGFLPSWAKEPSMAHKMINARAETVATKPAFRDAFRRYRCLVVADGFYEWEKEREEESAFLCPPQIREVVRICRTL